MSRNRNTLTQKFYTIKDVAKTWGYSEEHVRRLCRLGLVTHFRRRGKGHARYFFNIEQLEQMLTLHPIQRRAA